MCGNVVSNRILPILLTVSLAGCSGNYSTVYRSEALDRTDRLITQDAKQKGILRQIRSADGKLATCIEPSPDALSVFAATAAGNVSTANQFAAAFGGTRAESGANIGLRTQTITILRDQGYRICEAYANSGINPTDYAQLLRRNQVLTTASLAIEQLTGAVVGPSVAIGASGSLEVDQAAVTAAGEKFAAQEKAVGVQEGVVAGKVADEDKARASSDDAEAKATAKKKELDALGAADPARPALQQQYDVLAAAATKAADTHQAAREATRTERANLEGERRKLSTLQTVWNDARNPDHKTRTNSEIIGAAVANKDVGAVAAAVQNIVNLAFSKSYMLDFCQMYWSGSITTTNAQIGSVCARILDSFMEVVTGPNLMDQSPTVPFSGNSPVILSPPSAVQ